MSKNKNVWLVQTSWEFPGESGHEINYVCSNEDVALSYMDQLRMKESGSADSGDYPDAFGEYTEDYQQFSWTISSIKYPDLNVMVWIEKYDVLDKEAEV